MNLSEFGAFSAGAMPTCEEVDAQVEGYDPAEVRARAEAANGSVCKRGIDLVLAVVSIVMLLPALLLIALAIRIDSPGPALFRQERYGKDKVVFKVFKFRTMRVLESVGSFTQVTIGDTRLTALGRVLRRTSLDELPQLFNVVKGDMSLVGPRPHALAMDDLFGGLFPGYSDRHLVRPGMTGLAQVRGHRGPTETSVAIAERLRHDRAYIATWSVWLDLTLLVRTPSALIHKNAV